MTSLPSKVGRPRSCLCGSCSKCKHATYMRNWWNKQTAEKRALYISKRNTDLIHAGDRKRQITKERKAWKTTYNTTYYKQRPEQQAAHSAVQRALRAGKLTKSPCNCGSTTVHAHHHKGYDTAFQLDITWLCPAHHREAHGVILRTAREIL